MLFKLEEDHGDVLTAYLAPDDPSETARLRVVAGDRILWEGEANETRPQMIWAGRHRSGLCGFRIGPEQAPGLSAYPDLELADAETDLTIWRRAAHLPRLPLRIFRLETSFAPMTPFDLAAEQLFQAWYPNIDRLGQETATQTFLHGDIASVYVSGRVLLNNHAYLHDLGFQPIALLRDPYLELAERMTILSGRRGGLAIHLGDRDRIIFGPAIEALSGLDVADPAAVAKWLRRIDRGAAGILSNPLARQLTTSRPDEYCGADAVSAGLRALSSFAVVGVEEAVRWFERAAADLFGVENLPGRSDPHEEETVALAEILAGSAVAQSMIEADLEIYDAVVEVMEAAALAD